jgi:hypothetical protein
MVTRDITVLEDQYPAGQLPSPVKHLLFGYLATLDADGQHPPESLPWLTAPVQRQ